MPHSVTTPKRGRPGVLLAMTVIFLSLMVIVITTVYERTGVHSTTVRQRVATQAARGLAESAIEKAVFCLNNPSNTADCPNNPSFTGENSVSLGNGTYTTTVSGSGNSRTIDATATISSGGRDVSQTLRITLTTTTTNVAFQYGVQAGIGGITLNNNAYISGNVYAGGSVTGTNGSYITGDVILTPNTPTLDATSNPSSMTLATFGSNSSTNDWVAQSFVPTITERTFSLDLKLAKHGTPTSTVTAYIYSDSSNAPGSDLTSGGQQITVTIPSDGTSGWENGWTNQIFSPSTNPILDAGTKYWLVLRTNSVNGTNNWRYAVATNDDAAYADGTGKIDGDNSAMPAACNPSACDIAFRINMGGVTPTLNIPTVGGNAYAHTIDSTDIAKKAYYQTVTGTVRANTAVSNDTCTEGENGPNCFDNSADQSPANFPISDAQIAQMEAQAALGGTTVCSPTCTISNGTSVGPRKYVGDVQLALNAVVTLSGTIWVDGNLNIENGARFQLDNNYGANSGSIIVDSSTPGKGLVVLSNNGDLRGNSTAGTYIMLIATYADLNTYTAIDVRNNLTAGVLYAPHGIASISNNASLKEVTAQKLVLQNNASVIYETGLANVNFTSGPGGSWIYQKGSYQIIEN